MRKNILSKLIAVKIPAITISGNASGPLPTTIGKGPSRKTNATLPPGELIEPKRTSTVPTIMISNAPMKSQVAQENLEPLMTGASADGASLFFRQSMQSHVN
jgi:hypothetical protein